MCDAPILSCWGLACTQRLFGYLGFYRLDTCPSPTVLARVTPHTCSNILMPLVTLDAYVRHKLFHHYDLHNAGGLRLAEFTLCVRREAKLSERTCSNIPPPHTHSNILLPTYTRVLVCVCVFTSHVIGAFLCV